MTGYPFNHHQLIRRIGDRLTLPLPTRQYTTLKRLELTDMEFQPATAVMVKYLLDCCSPVLEELLISVSSGIAVGIESDDEDEDYTESDENEGLAVKQYSKETGNADASVQAQAPYITVEGREWKLWRLVLRGDLGRQGSLVWLPLMQRCFQLQEFFISVYCNQMIKRLAYTLRHYCPKISDITLRCMTEIPQDDSMISDLIQSSQSLKRLSISFFSGFGPLSTAALVGHSTTLETLVLEDCYGIISEDIQAVLSSCANLKTFRVVPTHNTSTAYLEADDLVDSPWACLRLEHLQLIIEGIPRPDIRNNRYGERLTGPLHDGTITGFDLQKKVYQQLGKLTKLRELWLGFNNENLDDIGFDRFTIDDLHLGFFDSGEQVECLEFSLESGLELLHGLKELRVLKIDSLRTRIGLSEAMWMGREWPKLKRIYGMVFRGNAALPESVIWLTKNRKDIHLVPLPGNFSVLQ
ncbi:hypothetical protein BGX27_005033 [Mortierella sp. AM989]|nr:hypothetical protein BGX27_005033 [Mortierella sp. AM989]